ncbi:hypothetical protein AB4254_08965 [Vibrio breoganii]
MDNLIKTHALLVVVLGSIIINLMSILVLFGLAYSVINTVSEGLPQSVIYMRSVGIVTFLLVVEDVAGFLFQKSKWTMVNIISISFAFLLVDFVPSGSLLYNLTAIEVVGMVVFPIACFGLVLKRAVAKVPS